MVTQLSRTRTHDKPRTHPARFELSSACSYPPLHLSIIPPLYFVDIMASLVALATALLWKFILSSLLHKASRTLADDTISNDRCWFPNGVQSNLDRPCTDDAIHGTCCPEGFVCMNNGICKQKGADFYMRESCTDRNWLDPSCSNMCLSGWSFVACSLPVSIV